MKKMISICFIITLVSMITIGSYALGEVSVVSSDVFKFANLNAKPAGTVTFSATLKNKGDISITFCALERLDEGKWVFVASLTVPASKSNTYRYLASKDYSSNLTQGNSYRFKATFLSNGEKYSTVSNTIAY